MRTDRQMDDACMCCVSTLILTSRQSINTAPVWLPFSIRKLYLKNVTTVRNNYARHQPHQAPFSLLFLAVGVFFSWTPDVVTDFKKQFLSHPTLISWGCYRDFYPVEITDISFQICLARAIHKAIMCHSLLPPRRLVCDSQWWCSSNPPKIV